VGEALAVWAGATLLLAALYWIGKAGVGFISDHLAELAALLFWGLPTLLIERRGGDLADYGWRARPFGRNAAWAVGAVLVILPAFALGFAWWHGALPRLGQVVSGAMPLRFHPAPLLFPLTHLIVVALPEELFYRGYLLGALEGRWPSGVRVLSVTIGPALLLSSVLFAFGHALVDLDPGRFAVFFPSLAFAWLRQRTGSIAAGAFFHAACNVWIDTLARTLL
jgi:membrane protease YdiL (CAAX protease family)